MGIRRFTYTYREDQADRLALAAAISHKLDWEAELDATIDPPDPTGVHYRVDYEISPSMPIMQWNQLFYTITITLRERLVGL